VIDPLHLVIAAPIVGDLPLVLPQYRTTIAIEVVL